MANAIFVGWGVAVRGREQKALQLFGEAVEFWTRQHQQGNIESFDTYALDPHGGDLGGFLVARGTPEQISRLRDSEELNRLNTRAAMVVENFGVVGASTGAELERLFGDFGSLIAELG
jgi:hypothetical protein